MIVGGVLMILGMVGAISIWPSSVGLFYPVFLFLALVAFNGLRR